jgi:FtsP/CotA-like multicopper oxidase with cupredoxin domain
MRVALCLLLASCRRSAEVAEFAGSYPAEAAPNGVVREVDLVAAPASIPMFDGRRFDVWAYNGQVPGPTLRLRLGETLRVRFTNQLPQPTTIHWHGMRVPNAMDGVPHVTQPPVAPGATFIYEFTPKDAGTFWFHPHLRSSEQVERGLYGVLIVEDAEPPPFSRDELWVLDDWLLTRDGTLFSQFNTRHDLAHDGRWGNLITVNGRRTPRLTVRPGERLRLRLLNVANGRVFKPDFGTLHGSVIAVDGLYAANPVEMQGIELAPGNRMDLDLEIPAASVAEPIVVRDRFTRQELVLAEIAIEGEAVSTPPFASPAQAHVPAWRDAGVRSVPRKEFHLNARSGGPFGIEWTINGAAMDHHTHAVTEPLDVLPLGEFSHLRFVNDSARLHPMHMHGVFFKVLARNGSRVDEGHFRDTVLLRPRETVDIGLVPEDPGRWMLHCHILEHAEAGMMTLLEVR